MHTVFDHYEQDCLQSWPVQLSLALLSVLRSLRCYQAILFNLQCHVHSSNKLIVVVLFLFLFNRLDRFYENYKFSIYFSYVCCIWRNNVIELNITIYNLSVRVFFHLLNLNIHFWLLLLCSDERPCRYICSLQVGRFSKTYIYCFSWREKFIVSRKSINIVLF